MFTHENLNNSFTTPSILYMYFLISHTKVDVLKTVSNIEFIKPTSQ